MSRPSITPQFSAIDLGSLDDTLRMDVVITNTLSKDIFENEFDSLIQQLRPRFIIHTSDRANDYLQLANYELHQASVMKNDPLVSIYAQKS